MINAKPRFALVDDEQLYDYVGATYIKIGPPLKTPEGVWDTNVVAEQIRANKSIEKALIPTDARTVLVEQENVALKVEISRLRTQLSQGTQPPAVEPPISAPVEAEKELPPADVPEPVEVPPVDAAAEEPKTDE